MRDVISKDEDTSSPVISGDSETQATTRLKWFNGPKGFGFVVPEGQDIDAFLHITTLQKAGIEALGEGARLRCRISGGAKGAQVLEVLELLEPGQNPETLKSRQDAPGGSARDVTRLEGTVKWYKPEKGFGFVMADDGKKDVFVHKTCLDRHGLATLEPGTRVSMEVKTVAKGREAVSFELI